MSDTHRRIVIADDDDDVRTLLAEYLGRHGWRVLEAVNGLEALLHVKREHPHAVLLDLHMPRLGGIETLQRIRAFAPTVTVVIISGNLDAEVRREAERIGAAAVLDKPVDLHAVLAALDPAATVRPARGAAAPPSPVSTTVAPSGRSHRVLIVDDDADIRTMLEEFLRTKGYQARSAADGSAALRELVSIGADAVLLDIDMPGLNGVDALPALRAVSPRAAVIMISGTTNEELAKRTLAAGAFDFVAKPIDLVHLLDALETALAMDDAAR